MYTYSIIILTVIVSYLCFNNRDLMSKLAFTPYDVIKKNQWYRIITHGFVHADSLHLLVNMFTFWSFGAYIEQTFGFWGFGSWAYPLLYFGGMIVASLYDLFRYNGNPSYSSIGASGAVSAVLFAAIFLNPWSKILLFAVIPIPGILFGVVYLFYCQYMAKKSVDNINHNAHFYGAVFGFVFPGLMNPALFKAFMNQFLHF